MTNIMSADVRTPRSRGARPETLGIKTVHDPNKAFFAKESLEGKKPTIRMPLLESQAEEKHDTIK